MNARDPGTPFTAPWQAQVFALVDSLRNAGVLEAGEWSQVLGARLATLAPDCRDADAVWGCWVAALEGCLIARGIAGALQLTSLRQSWALAAEKTPHGEAVELGTMAYRLAGLARPQPCGSATSVLAAAPAASIEAAATAASGG